MSIKHAKRYQWLLGLLLLCQCLVFGTTAGIISDPRMPVVLAAGMVVIAPAGTSCIIMILCKLGWIRGEEPENRSSWLWLRKYFIVESVFFMVLNGILPLGLFRYNRIGGAMVVDTNVLDRSKTLIAESIFNAASAANYERFPTGLSDLVAEQHLQTEVLWPLKPGAVYTRQIVVPPADSSRAESNQVDSASEFEYFGSGVNPHGGPGTVILSSKDILDDGRRIIVILGYSSPWASVWVSAGDYQKLRSAIESHQPIAESKWNELNSSISQLPYGDD